MNAKSPRKQGPSDINTTILSEAARAEHFLWKYLRNNRDEHDEVAAGAARNAAIVAGINPEAVVKARWRNRHLIATRKVHRGGWVWFPLVDPAVLFSEDSTHAEPSVGQPACTCPCACGARPEAAEVPPW